MCTDHVICYVTPLRPELATMLAVNIYFASVAHSRWGAVACGRR
jgi:hypothetical protein